MAEDYNGTPLPEDQNPEPGSGDQNDNIPDWMKDAGWETSSGTFDESKPVFDDLDSDEDEIVPADIPAWLEEAAPEGFSSDPNATPAFEGLDVDEPFITTGDLVPPPSMDTPATEAEPEPIQEPDQIQEPAAPAEGDEFDIPTWLENLELDEDSQETAVAWLENMPENLRATEEELQAAKEVLTEEPEIVEDLVDELAWIDEIASEPEQPSPTITDEQAELSEDLVASELIPETTEPNQLFEQDEIESMETELPSWLKELGDDQPDSPVSEEAETTPPPEELAMPPESQEDAMPDWLRATEETEIPKPPEDVTPVSPEPASEVTSDFPEWLSGFEDSTPDAEEDSESLEWLDNLAGEEKEHIAPEAVEPAEAEDYSEEPAAEETVAPQEEKEEMPQAEPSAAPEDILQPEGVSASDDTLNAQVPDWLSKIGDTGELEESEPAVPDTLGTIEDSEPPAPEDDFSTTDSWLDQISEKPPDATRDQIAAQESEVIDWLDDMDGLQEQPPAEEVDEPQLSIPDAPVEESPPIELETAKYFEPEELAAEETTDDLPDWLSELKEDDQASLSLEEAIRQSEHDLNDAEVDYLTRMDEKQEDDADWLSKLDQGDLQPDLEPIEDEPAEVEDIPQEQAAPGGMLDRLRDTSEFKSEEDVPQWLADIKEEEDPQETAVLWLQQFVNQGDAVDIQDEIKRYTDELDPGDSVPKWMEDLKNEEDPQTTAMLWLEKLSATRETKDAPKPLPIEEGDSDWLADLEREASQDAQPHQPEEIKDFKDPDEGWLADLEIDEKLKTEEEEIPEWSKAEEESPEAEPPWMKATSPLEGDFYTDELASGEEKEVEVPEWLAGYAEGERPEEEEDQDSAEEEYTWLSATDAPATPRTPLDLNKAAISQLEGILGISHQIARGIVSYREKHGPYKDFSDLKDVPEIKDEQTIDILKPEVFISEVPPEIEPPAPIPAEKPKPTPPSRKPAKKSAAPVNFEETLVTARARINDKLIGDAIELYSALVKKKKFLDEVINDLQKASLDHPLEISVQKTLGDAFMQKDMLDEALEAYSKAEDLLS